MERFQVNWDDNEDVKKFVLDKWSNRGVYKDALEQRWLEIISTYEGLDYSNYKLVENRIVRDYNVPRWRVRLTINLLLPYVRTAAAKHLRNRPIFDVLPATNSNNDIAVAELGKKTLRSFWFNNNVNYQFIDLVLWVTLTGNAFLYAYWDTDAGPTIELSPQDFIPPEMIQQVQTNPEAAVALMQQAQAAFQQFVQSNNGSNKTPAGDMCIDIPTPFDMLFPYSTRFDRIPWLIHSEAREPSYYDERGIDSSRLARPETREIKFRTHAKRVNHLFQRGVGGTAKAVGDLSDEILELKCWIPRCRQLPEGRWIILAGSEVIHNVPNPYRHGKIPYVHFFADKIPGKIWAISAASQIEPIVREQQKAVSELVENRRMMGRPKWLVYEGSVKKRSSFTSEPGEIIRYSGPVAPQAWTPPNPPRFIFDTYGLLKGGMDQIMAQQDATRGVNPSGGRSAAVVQELQAADDGALGLIGLGFDTGFSYAGRLLLSTAAQFYREDRLLTYIGDNNTYESTLLKRGALIGDSKALGADYFNVRVTQFSQFGLSRTGQIELLKLLLQFNVFDQSPASRERVLRFVQMGYFEDEIDEWKVDRGNAHKENLLLSQGQPIRNAQGINMFMPGIEDHDETHIKTHLEFMKRDEFKTQPPEIQGLFQQHIQQHKLLMITKIVEPQVLQIAGMLMAANLNNIPPQLLGAFNANQPAASGK